MKIKKVKCCGCDREFNENEINMINKKYLCNDCVLIILKIKKK
jgi:hypothetical protein